MKVFISHVSKDRALAKYLADELNQGGFEVWRAEEQILPGENWALKIGHALEESDAMVVLVSPDSVASPSVRNEINYALGASNYAGRVIPVVVRPTKEMPWFLRTLKPLRLGKDRVKVSKSIIDGLQRSQG